MTLRMIKRFFLYLLAALLLFSCPNPVSKSDDSSDEDDEASGAVFESFYLAPQFNTSLNETVIGEIGEDTILLVVPGSADTSLFIASFDTNAVTVTVNGEVQTSGGSYQDFSGATEYVLTSESGDVHTYSVSMIHTGEWHHMEGSPVGVGSLPQMGLLHGFFPELLYLDSGSGQLRSLYFNAFDSSFWVPFSGTGHFGVPNITQYSSANADGPVWAAYTNDVLPDSVQLYKYDPSGGWMDVAPIPLGITGPAGSLNLFSAYHDSVCLSLISGADSLKRAELWQFNGAWSQIGGGSLSDDTAVSLCAAELSSGIWAAATFEEYPDSLYLYQYNYETGTWFLETVALSSYLAHSLFQDENTGQPLLVASCLNGDDSNQIDINWLSWDPENRAFTDFVPPLTLPMALTDPLDPVFSDNTPLIATSGSVYEYINEGWRELGGEAYSDSPASSFSVVAASEGVRFVSYQDSDTSEIRIKMVELE